MRDMCRHKRGINTARWTAAGLSGPFIGVHLCENRLVQQTRTEQDHTSY